MILPRWRCHKVVAAAPIAYLGPRSVVVDHDGRNVEIQLNDDECRRFFTMKQRPTLNDFFVIYDDGYRSWSPARAFLAGYTRLGEDWSA
jgi:hypothetical protein